MYTTEELYRELVSVRREITELKNAILPAFKSLKEGKWMTEQEVMDCLQIKITYMRILRTKGVLMGYSSTGRNFKYKRADVMEYIEGRKSNEMHQYFQERKLKKTNAQ